MSRAVLPLWSVQPGLPATQVCTGRSVSGWKSARSALNPGRIAPRRSCSESARAGLEVAAARATARVHLVNLMRLRTHASRGITARGRGHGRGRGRGRGLVLGDLDGHGPEPVAARREA